MSGLVLFHAMIETLRISIPTVLDARSGRLTTETCDRRLRSWSERLLSRVDAHVSVEGLENLERIPGPYVVVSNHQSHYDIPALLAALPLSLRMAAKKEIFSTPIWGKALHASGFVEIDRSNPKEAVRALRKAGDTMRRDSVSLFVAPEGTRSIDGELGKFKRGAFEVARVTGVPVLPVAIQGTRHIHQRGSCRLMKGCSVRVRILPPIAPVEFDRALADRVRSSIAAALNMSSVVE